MHIYQFHLLGTSTHIRCMSLTDKETNTHMRNITSRGKAWVWPSVCAVSGLVNQVGAQPLLQQLFPRGAWGHSYSAGGYWLHRRLSTPPMSYIYPPPQLAFLPLPPYCPLSTPFALYLSFLHFLLSFILASLPASISLITLRCGVSAVSCIYKAFILLLSSRQNETTLPYSVNGCNAASQLCITWALTSSRSESHCMYPDVLCGASSPWL